MFADLDLARRLERTEGAAGLAFVKARIGDKECAERHGVYLMFDGLDSPLSQTFGLGMEEPVTDETLSEIEEFFAQRKAPVNHEVCPLAGVPLLEMLVTRGYVPCEVSNVLFMDLKGERPRPNLNLDLSVSVAGEGDIDVYADAMARGWREAGDFAASIKEMSHTMAKAVGYVGFLVQKGGEPIATGGLFVHQGVALLAGACTVPEERGQGAQRAVLASRLAYAANAGCHVAMLVTEPGSASQRNGERNGFRIAYTRTKWRRKEVITAPSTL
jgi:GNAT superfamily N-acetyltransferase